MNSEDSARYAKLILDSKERGPAWIMTTTPTSPEDSSVHNVTRVWGGSKRTYIDFSRIYSNDDNKR